MGEGVGWVPREIWLPRDSEPRQLQVFTRPEEEEPRVQICAGAGRGYGLSTTVSLGRYPRGDGGGRKGRLELAALPRRGQPWAAGSPCWTPNLPREEKRGGIVASIPQLPSFQGVG